MHLKDKDLKENVQQENYIKQLFDFKLVSYQLSCLKQGKSSKNKTRITVCTFKCCTLCIMHVSEQLTPNQVFGWHVIDDLVCELGLGLSNIVTNCIPTYTCHSPSLPLL